MRNFWQSEFPIGDPDGYGKFHDPVSMGVATAGASVGGGLLGKGSAKKAAKIQGGAAQAAQDRLGVSTRAANDTLTDGYIEQAAQLAPWLQGGGQGLNQLLWGLGMDSQVYDPNAQALGPRKTADDYRNELVGQFTTPGAKNKYGQFKLNAHDTIDEKGLKAAIDQKMAEDDARYAAAANAPLFQGQGEKGGLLRNFQMSDFQEDPGYQFALDQGMRGLQNSAASRGGLLSGATLKALTRFNQDTANNQYQNSYDRFNQNQQNQLNTLYNLSNAGQGAAGAIAGYNANARNQQANNLMTLGTGQASLLTQAGNAAAAGVIGGNNAMQQGIRGAVNTLGGLASMRNSGY
jgi:hypothetical protein